MPNTLKVLDLFSGIGGFSLGLERAGMETVAFCEIELFCQQVLQKHWPELPISKDIRELHYHDGCLHDAGRVIYAGAIDLICGGFPCQPFSVAGRKKGTADNRDLWPEMFRLIQQAQPTWVIGENVAHFTNLAFTRTKTDLESAGYTVQPFMVPACAVGAPHRRDRVWIVGHAKHHGQPATTQQGSIGKADERPAQRTAQDGEPARPAGAWDVLPDTDDQRCQGSEQQAFPRQRRKPWEPSGGYPGWRDGWPVSAPRVCGVDDGIPDRTHRLKSLGNSVVPQIPELIGKAIIESIRG